MLFGMSATILQWTHNQVLKISGDSCFEFGQEDPVLLIKVLLVYSGIHFWFENLFFFPAEIIVDDVGN